MPAPAPDQSATEAPAPVVLPVENGAPVLDSAKEEPVAPAEGEAAAPVAPVAPAGPPPTTDAEAQAAITQSAPIAPAPDPLAEQGQRVDAAPARERPLDAEVVREVDNRIIFEINNQIVIQNYDTSRLRQAEDQIYYEDLSGGRTREVIERPNGAQVITIRNRWGDIIQRSRITPDGREILLAYTPENDVQERRVYVDPGFGLPPLQLTIPIEEYILDARVARDSDYLEFLSEPPVERVERIYTIQEVQQSARIRDKVRRIDLDTLTFELGSAAIPEGEVQRLETVANAMVEILKANPAETFLLEGHTDAVGSNESNLILSDKRAESVAIALTNVFGIPPENLATQGYGERYLKIRTDAPERENRRVAIRRITALVTPIASR